MGVVLRVEAITQMCNPSDNFVYQFSIDACPAGVLFHIPLKAECFRASSDNDVSVY